MRSSLICTCGALQRTLARRNVAQAYETLVADIPSTPSENTYSQMSGVFSKALPTYEGRQSATRSTPPTNDEWTAWHLKMARLERLRMAQQKLATAETQEFEQERITKSYQEEISNCFTPAEVVDWMNARIFGPSGKATKAYAAGLVEASVHSETEAPSPFDSIAREISFTNYPSLYPALLAHLIATLRDKHNSPNTALLPYTMASSLSVTSFVAGCDTAVYAQVIKTRWQCWNDILGVRNLLKEMMLAGVKVNHAIEEVVKAIATIMTADTMAAKTKAIKEFGVAEDQVNSKMLDTYRYFSTAEHHALVQMEDMLEREKEKLLAKKAAQQADRRLR